MNNILISNKAILVIAMINKAIAKSPTGVSFLSIKGYTNANGEISDSLINIGMKYESAKSKDIETLKAFDITQHEFKSAKTDILIAVTELLNGLEKPNENRSNGQKDAYTHIVNGLKVHNETGKLYIYGYRQHKTVLKAGEYKEVKSSPKTIAKNEVKKELLRTGKFTQFVIEEISELRGNGETLEII